MNFCKTTCLILRIVLINAIFFGICKYSTTLLLVFSVLVNAAIFYNERVTDIPIEAAAFMHISVGCGEDRSIAELASIIRDVVQYGGETVYNSQFPDGTPRKLLDVSRPASLGRKAMTSLEDGIYTTSKWYLENTASD